VTGDARKVEQLWRQSQAKRIKLDGRAT
jgi:hypothetical protein